MGREIRVRGSQAVKQEEEASMTQNHRAGEATSNKGPTAGENVHKIPGLCVFYTGLLGL